MKQLTFNLLCLATLTGTFSAGTSFATAPTTASSFTLGQTQQIQHIVHDYIVANPEVLVQAGQELAKKEQRKVQNQAVKLIRANGKELFRNPNSVVIGPNNAKITVVFAYDYQCIHCRESAKAIDNVIEKNPDIRFVFKELPIFGKYSKDAAYASLATYDLNPKGFLKFHNALMKAPIPFNLHTITDVAQKEGYSVDALTQAMKNKKYASIVDANLKLATKLLQPTIGSVATPIVVVGETDADANNRADVKFYPGQIDQSTLQQLIDQVEQNK